jgi:hypothetical protein
MEGGVKVEGVEESKEDRVARVFLKTLKALIRLEVAASAPTKAGKSKGVKRPLPTEDPANPVVEEARPGPPVPPNCEVNVITGKACPVATEARVKAEAQTKHNGALLNVCKRCKLDLAKEKKRKSASSDKLPVNPIATE